MSTAAEQTSLEFPEGDVSIDLRFRAFHETHPWVYARLVALARQWVRAGHSRVGIGMLWEVLRWQRGTSTNDPTSFLKLNNSYRALMARKIMDENPDLAGVFETRELRSR